VVDLLGGIGDLVMLLPAIHGLARRNPGAALRVLTHEPGADLVRGDPVVTEVRTPRHGRPGAEREAVAEALAARRPDLAVTTTRHDGSHELIAACVPRCVTDLWRRPPPDEPVGDRYLRILHAEGLLGPEDLGRPPRVWLHEAEVAAGEAVLAACLPPAARRPPVVLVPDTGMAVKRWPPERWRDLARILAARGHPVLAVTPLPDAPAVPLPAGDLRRLAACFRAVAARDGIVVGGDTGPVRLAGAAGAWVVALFGPTSALRYGVPGAVNIQGAPHCTHRRPTSIAEQVCWWEARCPLSPDGPACMAAIDVDRVADAIARLTG